MRARVTLEDGLMTVDDIANVLQLHVAHVRDRLIREPTFPRPVINRPRFRRWTRTAFERWLSAEAGKSMRGSR